MSKKPKLDQHTLRAKKLCIRCGVKKIRSRGLCEKCSYHRRKAIAEGDMESHAIKTVPLNGLPPLGAVELTSFCERNGLDVWAAASELGIEPISASMLMAGEARLSKGDYGCLLMVIGRYEGGDGA